VNAAHTAAAADTIRLPVRFPVRFFFMLRRPLLDILYIRPVSVTRSFISRAGNRRLYYILSKCRVYDGGQAK
jgi:hypothetical protein